MPIYFFHIRGGEAQLDDKEGTDLPDLEVAMREARESAREIAADNLRAKEDVDSRRIEVADSDGRVLGTVTIRDVLKS
jgi:hypothetical protein